MTVDKDLANFAFLWDVESGDTGKGRVEHRSIIQLWFTHHMM